MQAIFRNVMALLEVLKSEFKTYNFNLKTLKLNTKADVKRNALNCSFASVRICSRTWPVDVGRDCIGYVIIRSKIALIF